MYQNHFQPHTLLRRETLLLDLRDVIEENIRPLVSRAKTELNTIPSGNKFSYYTTSGLLAEAIEGLHNLCQRIDRETADEQFVKRIHHALAISQIQNAAEIQITGSTVLTTSGDQERIIGILQKIAALCKNSACCLKSFRLILKATEQRMILTTSQESSLQAEILRLRLAQVIDPDYIKLLRTIAIGDMQSVHLSISYQK